MSGRYTDLSIHLRAAWNRQHILNGGPSGAPVPGWFLRVTRNEGHDDVVPETWVDLAAALTVARTIDGFASAGPCVEDAVVAADEAMLHELRRQLEAAEAVAARIPTLRAAIALSEGGVESGAPETKGTPE